MRWSRGTNSPLPLATVTPPSKQCTLQTTITFITMRTYSGFLFVCSIKITIESLDLFEK